MSSWIYLTICPIRIDPDRNKFHNGSKKVKTQLKNYTTKGRGKQKPGLLLCNEHLAIYIALLP